ncbi:MAG: ATP-binding cassette domain-containing protein [Alicyclobacillus sp.]|nr:ATP-binding cassette domain-containing protein [Alicyclobacillus sp.]
MIRVKNLVKTFKRPVRKQGPFASIRTLFSSSYIEKPAVNDISFEIKEGELVGYIGPNGAGKSTSIKMLTGILVSTSGVVEVNGLVPYRDRKQNARQIGVVFGQKTQLWWDVPVIDSLNLLKDIYKVPQQQFKRNLDLFSELLDLHQFQHTPVRQLSLGQRMRADLAAALLHSPRILFLDEPTIGVDVVAKERLRQFIKTINQEQRVTVLLTTHDMSDIERLCSRMMIIDRGQIIYDGTVENIRTQHGRYRTLVVEFEQFVPDFDVPKSIRTKSDGTKKWFQFDRADTSPSELIAYISGRYPIVDLTVEEPAIEDMVREIYEGQRGIRKGESAV